MKEVTITLDGREVKAQEGATILEVAREHGIEIPTLCSDDKLEPYGSCWLCIVDVEGARGFVPSCSTRVADGMVVTTNSDDIRATRRLCLELLLSDHYGDCVAPCTITCPAGIDIPGYIDHIKNGRFQEAVALIKERNPLPLIIGRVCPHTCETQCRRNNVDEPIGINNLKRFAADYDIACNVPYTPELAPSTGKKVAIIGGGPAGLSAAYYLVQMGHEPTIFDAMPALGGMLRYGIPEYRLPNAVLDKEIQGILDLGVKAETGVKLGEDISVEGLLDDGFDAVLLAAGAWDSRSMRVEGEDLGGVIHGIHFLRDVVLGKDVKVGPKVCVIGGGNTAIDAARTALRLGAPEVTILYRRSRAEMPANDIEIEEAEEENVAFHFLAAPTKLIGSNGTLEKMEYVEMELGEADESGRRRPVPIPGSEKFVDVDTVIAAIGQGPDASFLDDGTAVEVSRRGTVQVDDATMRTGDERVFAAGDLVTGAATAIEAIAGGRKAAIAIDRFLNSEPLDGQPYVYNHVKGDLENIDKADYEDIEKAPRAPMPTVPPEKRVTNFDEMCLGLTQEAAIKEAERCLQCICEAAEDCKLRNHASEYDVAPARLDGARRHYKVDDSHATLKLDPNKCVMCGLCVRLCSEIKHIDALGFAGRGFGAVVQPIFGRSLNDTNCDSCGECADICPTGSIVKKLVEETE